MNDTTPPPPPIPTRQTTGGTGRRNLLVALLLLSLIGPIIMLIDDVEFLASQDDGQSGWYFLIQTIVSGLVYLSSLIFIVPAILIAGYGAKKHPARKKTFTRLMTLTIMAPLLLTVLGALGTCGVADAFDLPARAPEASSDQGTTGPSDQSSAPVISPSDQ